VDQPDRRRDARRHGAVPGTTEFLVDISTGAQNR
jgi:hypothetical protein